MGRPKKTLLEYSTLYLARVVVAGEGAFSRPTLERYLRGDAVGLAMATCIKRALDSVPREDGPAKETR